jgi:hypothetical protein
MLSILALSPVSGVYLTPFIPHCLHNYCVLAFEGHELRDVVDESEVSESL